MEAESFQEAGDLARALAGEVLSQVFISEAADVVFTSKQSLHQGPVLGLEEIEAGVGAVVVTHGLGETVELVDPRLAVLDG